MQADIQCYRISANDLEWSPGNSGHGTERALFSSEVLHLLEHRLSTQERWTSRGPGLYLLTAGELQVSDGQTLQHDDLYWCRDSGETLRSGPSGATFYAIEPLQGIGQEMPSRAIVRAEQSWEHFDDPAGRPTQPVQVLLDGSLSALRTRFDPQYIAGEHWHDFDTLYFITNGRMQFGDEGWFSPGEIRAVHGGHSYGPERPGPSGVEFVLVSIGGPVALHWSDLEPPP